MKVVVNIALSIRKQVLSIRQGYAVVWEGGHVEIFEELSVQTLA